MKIKGYKVMNPDMTCLGFQYEVGKSYKHKGDVSMCSSGFHFCKELKDCYNYYSFDYKNIVCEVEGRGNTRTKNDKTVCEEITIIRKLELTEVLDLLNLFTSNDRGSWNKGSWNMGSENKGSENIGLRNKGSDNIGSENKGSGNKGSENTGSFNRGSWNKGSWNKGSWNMGSENIGLRNKGSDNIGSENKGSWNKGSWNMGSWNIGSRNTGSWNTGMHNFGSYSIGVMNYTSFIGDKHNCYCFNKPTEMSLIKFYRKYMKVLKEIKRHDFNNVSELPNYSKKEWDLISKHI